MLRRLLIFAGVAAIGIAAVGIGLLAWRAVLRADTAQAVAIHGPNSIDEARFVPINGVDQWITIRGDDLRNPVLLILHGGPGSPESYLARQFRPMEHRYVVVQWDQRGGGKTLARAGGRVDPAIDMATMVADGNAVTDYVRRRLSRDRLVLVGHSWGSLLGARMIRAKPSAYAAFVATGPGFRTQREWQGWIATELRDRATAAHDAKALAELGQIRTAPPWADDGPEMQHIGRAASPYMPPGLGYWGNAGAALTAPHWTLLDVLALSKGMSGMLQGKLWDASVRDSYLAGPFRFAVPVIVVEGDADLTTPPVFARRWLDAVDAPAKAYVVLPGQGHEALSYDNAAFTRALDHSLRPLLGA